MCRDRALAPAPWLGYGDREDAHVAYQLKSNEPVAKGLRRVVRKELRSAMKHLDDPHPSTESVHEARKSIKKVRAVLNLVGRTIDARGARKLLRRASRSLSPLRDAEVAVAGAKTLCTQDEVVGLTHSCQVLVEAVQRNAEQAWTAALRDRSGKRAVAALRKVRRAASHWHWKAVRRSVLASAVQRSYRLARRGMDATRTGDPSSAFHEWRKQVKSLWYALRLLEHRARIPGRVLTDLEHVETWLGHEHDLWVLRGLIATCRLPVPDSAGLTAAAEQRQRELRQRALALGSELFGTSRPTPMRVRPPQRAQRSTPRTPPPEPVRSPRTPPRAREGRKTAG